MNNTRPSRLVVVVMLAALVILPVVAVSSLIRNAEATTTVISSNTTLPSKTVNAGDTLIINPGVTLTMSGTLTNRGNIVNSGTINMNVNILNNYGIIIDAAGGSITTGTINNYESGIITEDAGSIHNYGDTYFSNYGKHASYGEVRVSYTNGVTGPDDHKEYRNFGSGVFESHGPARFFGFSNSEGGQATFHQGASLQTSVGGGALYTNGMIDNYGPLSVQGNYPGIIDISPNGILNNHVGGTILNSIRPGYDARTTIYGTLNNDGRFTNVSHIVNIGTFNNNGILENNIGGGGVLGIVDNSGIFNNDGSISNKGVVNNLQSGNFDNDGSFVNECGGVFNNQGTFTGNPVVNNCTSFPITHMSDTTASAGYAVNSAKPARAELATSTSQLIGDKIDSITLKLKRVGTISGSAVIGILDSNNNVKKAFGGALNVATLTTTYTDYEVHLTAGELYTIQSGDRIGIRYTGGTTTTWVAVMLDLDAADPFDGTKSYAQYYQGSWLSNTDRDMYMILKQTHG